MSRLLKKREGFTTDNDSQIGLLFTEGSEGVGVSKVEYDVQTKKVIEIYDNGDPVYDFPRSPLPDDITSAKLGFSLLSQQIRMGNSWAVTLQLNTPPTPAHQVTNT
jgi:hypothetical protein